MPTYLPPGQVATLHPFVMHHQQGAPHTVPSHSQAHVNQFHSIPGISSLQHWQNQQVLLDENSCPHSQISPMFLMLLIRPFILQVVSEGSQISTQDQFPPSQGDQNLLRSHADYNYEISVNGQALHPDYLDAHTSQGVQPDSVITSSTEESQVI